MEQLTDEEVRSKFEDVCGELNLDEEAKDSAWKAYQDINNDYVLEGPQIEWLACSLYVACRTTSTQTVEGDDYLGNSISLTQILRATKLNLVEFFRKIKKWLEMTKLPPIYLEKVEALERKFEVISVIFKKYKMEFATLFQPPDGSQNSTNGGSSRPRSRKPSKARPCTSSQLFQFGWVLYVHIKNQFPLISDDLVNSHYLLLCCLDMICAAAITAKRKDLLNQNFTGFPEGYDSPSFSPSLDFPWILPELCSRFSAIEKECQVVRDYYWWPSVRRLYESQTLHGIASSGLPELPDVLASFLAPASFQANIRSLKTAYELMMLQEGDFDERLFINSQSELDKLPGQQEVEEFEKLQQPGIIYQSPQHLQYGTPLTGREYISSKEKKLTPVSDANQSVIQLHLLLEGCLPEPSEILTKICSCCHRDPLRSIRLRLEAMSKTFLHAFKADSMNSPDNFALLRLQLSQNLYYKLLSAVGNDEDRKMSFGNVLTRSTSLQSMFEHDLFHKSLFALCIEIVLFSYNSHSKIFPWVLGIIDISPYHFYKVIEVVIKVESGFPRAIVKHLSKIEESVLSSLAWKSDSPLYESLDKLDSVPCYADVALPESPHTHSSTLSPLARLKTSLKDGNSSPFSARERYASPIPASSRRQLFTNKRPFSPSKSPTSSPLKHPLPIAPKPPQGVVQVTRLNHLQGAAAASILLQSLLQNSASPLKQSLDLTSLTTVTSTSSSVDTPIQALVSISNMTSPLKNSPDKGGGMETPSNIPHITLTLSPAQAKITANALTTPTPSNTSDTVQHVSPPKPKKTGSVALFYRKVYQMSFVRIKDLCERLELDTDILRKVWTCFEYSIMRSPDMMRDRYIDQLIMCSIYVVAKVLRKEVTFQEIMRQYRHQPQAKSHVYRSVLLNNGRRTRTHTCTATTAVSDPSQNENESQDSSASQPFDIDQTAMELGDSNVDNILYRSDIDIGTRGDIIQFYNKIYIGYIKDFVLKLSPDDGVAPTLSPLPMIRKSAVSPRKLSKNHQIFISPLKGNHSSLSPLAKTYVVSKSPASDLKYLNQAVSSAHSIKLGAKRQLDALLSSSPGITSPAKRPYMEHSRSIPNRQSTNLLSQREENQLVHRTSLSNGTTNSSNT